MLLRTAAGLEESAVDTEQRADGYLAARLLSDLADSSVSGMLPEPYEYFATV